MAETETIPAEVSDDNVAKKAEAKPENASKDDKDPKESKESNEKDVMFVQDVGFNVNVLTPGAQEPFQIQVSSMELVQEIHQLLMDREDTCQRTCFSLHLVNDETKDAKGNNNNNSNNSASSTVLDNFAELKSVEGLAEGSLIKVIFNY